MVDTFMSGPSFVGRAEWLALFRENLVRRPDDVDRRSVFALHGDGGIGKSFLLARLREIAAVQGRLTAGANEKQYDVPDVMRSIADDLRAQGVRLRRFEQWHASYLRQRRESPADQESPGQALAETAVRAGLGMAKTVPVVGFAAEAVDPKALAKPIQRLLAGNGRPHGSSPLEEGTRIFLDDLRQAGQPIALFFDTFEYTAAYLQGWLRDLVRDLVRGKPDGLPAATLVTIAGRHRLNLNVWSDCLGRIADVPLAPFTEVESRRLLASRGVTDEPRVAAALSRTGGFPLALAIVAQNCPDDPAAMGEPYDDLFERILQWETDDDRRECALVCSLARRIDQDVVALLAEGRAKELYEWLRAQAFVTPQDGGFEYHSIVRGAMVRVHRGRSLREWKSGHRRLAAAHRAWRDELDLTDEDGWYEPAWQEHMLEETYHRLCADGARVLPDLFAGGIAACHASVSLGRRWADAVAQAGEDGPTASLSELGAALRSAVEGDLDDGVPFLDLLLRQARLSWTDRAEAFRVRGRYHRVNDRLDLALADFDRSLEINPDHAQALSGRGETYRLHDRFEEALRDFDRAIEIDPEDDWTIDSRGRVYWALKRYDEALADFTRAYELNPTAAISIAARGAVHSEMGNHDQAVADFDIAIDLDGEYDWAMANRGEAYRVTDRYQEALADFDRAIDLDGEHAWAIASRAQTYHSLERYTEALADFDRAIELRGDYIWAIASRGATYQAMRRYEEAIADYGRVITIDPDYRWALAGRGRAYSALGRYAEALADLDRAIELDGEDAWSVCNRGETYDLMHRHLEAIADLDRALELGEVDAAGVLGSRGQAYTALGRYGEALADFDRAIELDGRYAWALALRGETYRLMRRYEEAIADFDRALEIDGADAWTIGGRAQTCLSAGRYQDARRDCDRALEIDTENAWAFEVRGRVHRALGDHQAACADLRRAVELKPDDDHLLDLAMTCGAGADELGTLAAVGVPLTEAWRLGGIVTRWLVERGVIAAERTACVAGERRAHAPGDRYASALASPDAGLHARARNGVQVLIGHTASHSGRPASLICPNCGAEAPLIEHDRPAARWYEVAGLVSEWVDGADPAHRCTACECAGRLRDWRFEPRVVFGHLAVRFWNWPPLAPGFAADLSQVIGHPVEILQA
ncbi:tetratricopeptide repeat protein [Sphaerisporangium perillae]|uniref:tetratricopeptide repeat protein n=1 Tax=Sphaerisporangium perillae TaxID=2935860 RepID=UPI00200FEA61|nr:tetratricopeptide repeat protein [Sphaerisporangium perillae]